MTLADSANQLIQASLNTAHPCVRRQIFETSHAFFKGIDDATIVDVRTQ